MKENKISITPGSECISAGSRQSNIRLIARLDIKGHNLIKGIHLEGLRVIGNPASFAQRYYEQGVDELIYMDAVASLYDRESLLEIIRSTSESIFVPMTVGGGIRSIDDAGEILLAGADKVAINTAAIINPKLIQQVAQKFGSQCMVLSIEAKRINNNKWEAYVYNGREPTAIDAIEWAMKGVELGAGEILVTSVDQEGTRSGFDCELVKAVSRSVSVPVIASGGMGNIKHMLSVILDGEADAVAMASVLHYKILELPDIRSAALEAKIPVRRV